MDKDFEKQLEYCNIPAWHEAGYRGQGMAVFCDDVGGGHAANVANVVQTILPEAQVFTGSIGLRIKSDIVQGSNIHCEQTGETLPFEEFIQKYNVRIINNSKDGGSHDKDAPKAVWLREMRDKYKLVLTGSAGNADEKPIDNSFYGAGIIVNGCKLDGSIPVWGHYAKDPGIDFCAFTAGLVGTSFAAPFLAGMAGLLLSHNPRWEQGDVYQYFLAHAEDLGIWGHDSYYGHGLPIMGETGEEHMEIVMYIGSNEMFVDGETVFIDQPPIIDKRSNRTLVPVRAIAEGLGLEVEWDEEMRKVTLRK